MRAWLFTIMHNQNVNAVRSAMREGKTVDIEEQSSTLVATTDPTVARQLHELDRALAQVPEDQRQVILLVGLEGMSYRDAARSSAYRWGQFVRACREVGMCSAS
jgi:RNA polymerase sigma-70 factor (ECF subfamily)